MEDFGLITTIALALGLALVGGLSARAIGLSPIVGYLAAGIILSPFTPGYDADTEELRELAELGVIFLMFGVGLHFNIADLLRVKNIAITGALVLIAAATAMGIAVSLAFGLELEEGIVVGLAVSVSSTVVLVKALEERGLFESIHGRVAVGWVIVEDLATVLFLVLIPSLGGNGDGADFFKDVGWAVLKAAAFVAFGLFAGARLIPRLLELVARTGSRELFILTVVAIALGIATGAEAFGLSVAIGAFIAGVVISETDTSHQAAADVVPLREAFAVLFFVSVGMLLDPEVVLENAGFLLAILAVLLIGKTLLRLLLIAGFPYPARTGLVVTAGLAQMGEFSFIVADEGLQENILSAGSYNVILAASVISITLNPAAFRLIGPAERFLRGKPPLWALIDRQGTPPSYAEEMRGHVIVAGYGRVGELTGHALQQLSIPYIVVEADIGLARRLSAALVPVVWGDCATPEVLEQASIRQARLLVVAVPDESSALLTVRNAVRANPEINTVVRGRTAAEIHLLHQMGAHEVVVPELEGGLEIMRQTLLMLGFDAEETMAFRGAQRDVHYGDDVLAH
ncbi:MAG: cation:proton antiporter [Dehalococcoidia bacterium]